MQTEPTRWHRRCALSRERWLMFRAMGYVAGRARAMGNLVCSIKQTEHNKFIMDMSPQRKSIQEVF